jgi:hypothetical protein
MSKYKMLRECIFHSEQDEKRFQALVADSLLADEELGTLRVAGTTHSVAPLKATKRLWIETGG